jgi:hypothetical protein
MYIYRSNLDTLLDNFTLSLSQGGSSDTITSITVNTSLNEFIAVTGMTTLTSSDNFDIRIITLPNVLSKAWYKGTAGSAAAAASRLDQLNDLTGVTLVRSLVTTFEVAVALEVDITLVYGLASNAVQVTLAATTPFNISFDDYERTFSCPVDGSIIDLNCPLTDDTHTCDHTSFGSGGVYHFTYTCPYVVPTCLYFDDALGEFVDDDDCEVVAGYSSDAVTCQCSRLGTFILSANVTQPSFQAYQTLSPTHAPNSAPLPTYSVAPSPRPTHAPSVVPTSFPTRVPTPSPTPCADHSPYCRLVKSFCGTSFCPTCPQAGYCGMSLCCCLYVQLSSNYNFFVSLC